MDHTHDTGPAPPQQQTEPPQPAAPGRQPTESQTEAPRASAGQPQPGEAPRAGVPAQRFITAMSTLLGAVRQFSGALRRAYIPYDAAYRQYDAVLVRRAQRQEMATQLAMGILFVGVGGAFGGVLSQIVKGYAPGALDRASAALRRPPTPVAPPPAGSISRREVIGLPAPPPRAQAAPAAPAAPTAAPVPRTDKALDVAAASGAAGDVVKEMIRRLTTGGGGALPGGSEPFEPGAMLQSMLASLDDVEAHAHQVGAALSAANERNEQLEADPLAAMQEVVARLGTPPAIPPPDFYQRAFWERNPWFREWQAKMMAAPHQSEIERLYLHDRLFLRDIEASCPGLVSQVRQRARANLQQRREEHDARMSRRLEQR